MQMQFLNFVYEDHDYGKEDNCMISLPDNANVKEFVTELQKFFALWNEGTSFQDYIDKNGELTPEMADDFKANYPEISVGDAAYFAGMRDMGLNSGIVAEAFVKRHPEFGAEILNFNEVRVSEYDVNYKNFFGQEEQEHEDLE